MPDLFGAAPPAPRPPRPPSLDTRIRALIQGVHDARGLAAHAYERGDATSGAARHWLFAEARRHREEAETRLAEAKRLAGRAWGGRWGAGVSDG